MKWQIKLALLILFVFPFAKAQTLRIQIIDGKTGKPIAHEHVNVFRNRSFSDLMGDQDVHGFITDAEGIVTTSAIAPDTELFGVSVDWHRECSKSYQWFQLSKVINDGLVSENTCKPKLEKTAIPGTLILFVREETFFEKMAH